MIGDARLIAIMCDDLARRNPAGILPRVRQCLSDDRGEYVGETLAAQRMRAIWANPGAADIITRDAPTVARYLARVFSRVSWHA